MPNEDSENSTRSNLIQVGLKLFGAKGYDATSIRTIASEADTNLASVNYHFGSKEGLRVACAEYIGGLFQSAASQLLGLDFLTGQTRLSEKESKHQELTPEQAKEQLLAVPTGLANLILNNPRSRHVAPFLMREMSHPSPAIDLVYKNVFKPVHTRLCELWGVATGEDAESDEVRLRVFSIMGQIVYFRLAQEIVMRRMDWQAVGSEEVEKIVQVVTANLRAALEQCVITESTAPEAMTDE